MRACARTRSCLCAIENERVSLRFNVRLESQSALMRFLSHYHPVIAVAASRLCVCRALLHRLSVCPFICIYSHVCVSTFAPIASAWLLFGSPVFVFPCLFQCSSELCFFFVLCQCVHMSLLLLSLLFFSLSLCFSPRLFPLLFSFLILVFLSFLSSSSLLLCFSPACIHHSQPCVIVRFVYPLMTGT